MCIIFEYFLFEKESSHVAILCFLVNSYTVLIQVLFFLKICWFKFVFYSFIDRPAFCIIERHGS